MKNRMKNLLNKIRKSNLGFTLVELIIVVAIIAVLSAVLVPQYIQYVERSRIGADESYISEVGHNLEIIAATDPDVNGSDVTVTIAADTGAITVAGADVADSAAEAVQAELDALFPTSDLVSNYYKTQSVTVTYTAPTASNPASSLAYSGTKNLD